MKLKIGGKLDITEEEIFSEIHHFLLRKNNRMLSNKELIEKTGVSAELIYKWVKTGKLNQTIFPNLGAPCERCGKITNYSKICRPCSNSITGIRQQEEKNKEWFNKIKKNSRTHSYHYK